MTPRVAFVVHAGREAALALATSAQTMLETKGVDIEMIALSPPLDGRSDGVLDDFTADLVVSLGGDGTFLRAAAHAHRLDIPILGVNFGRVGYLLEVPPAEIHHAILEALDGNLALERRATLSVEVPGDRGVQRIQAINEVSIEKTTPGHVVRVETRIDGEQFLTFAADGVLVATPTGSTAYNLSAGGPVLAPGLDGFVLTSVAPHFVLDRSVVLAGN
ncbi:MAG: NAD(+)/NADH kinase, partial [Actinomycetes bacterium]